MNQLFPSRPKNLLQESIAWLYCFWKFSRPHTIIGTTLSVFALYTIAFGTTNTHLTLTHLWQGIGTWIACLCGNIYIVGLNQLEDIAIDEINKPHLPLASGEFSRQTGKGIVIITGLIALILAAVLGHWLFLMVSISLALGTAYSLHPIRLKRFPFWAAFCIFTVRGIVINLGLFLHFNQVFQGEDILPASVWLLTLFILVFTIAIAIFKDVPDMEGDKQYQITTFSLLLGQKAIFNLSRWIITFCYLGIILAGILRISAINCLFILVTHSGLIFLLWWRSQDVNLENKKSISQFYQFIWKLFFLEYLLFPIACIFITNS